MAFGFTQVASPGSGAGTTYTLAVPASAAGALLVLGISYASNNRSISSVSDNVDGAWTLGVKGAVSGTGIGAYYKANATASARTITVVFDASTVTGVFLACTEYSGLLTTAAFDVNSPIAAIASGTSVTTASITTTQDTELLWSFGRSEGINRPLTTPTGYTSRVALDTTRFVLADNRQTVAGGETVTWAVTGGNSAIGAMLLTFKETVTATGRLFLPFGLDGLGGGGSLKFNPTL